MARHSTDLWTRFVTTIAQQNNTDFSDKNLRAAQQTFIRKSENFLFSIP
jgi:hypothetical protein